MWVSREMWEFKCRTCEVSLTGKTLVLFPNDLFYLIVIGVVLSVLLFCSSCSAKWTGSLSIPSTEKYTFQVSCETPNVSFSYIFWSVPGETCHKAYRGMNKVHGSPCLLLPVRIWPLYTVPAVIPAPTTTSIVSHFLLPCVWLLSHTVCLNYDIAQLE